MELQVNSLIEFAAMGPFRCLRRLRRYCRLLRRLTDTAAVFDFNHLSARSARPLKSHRRHSLRKSMEVILANPTGFCAGVERAIAIVERALKEIRRTDLCPA